MSKRKKKHLKKLQNYLHHSNTTSKISNNKSLPEIANLSKERLQANIQLVTNAFNLEELRECCSGDLLSLAKSAECVIVGNPAIESSRYGYKNQDMSVLAVAHTDSHQESNYVGQLDHPVGRLVFCPRVDDRLGVYTICKLLPKLGIKTDLLLTDCEETGNTTAKLFKTDKQYNWLISFDRMGTDVVMYNYLCDEMKDLLKYYKLEASGGAFSCIRSMESLAVKGFNWGIAYENYHSIHAYFNLDIYIKQLAKFLAFYEDFHNVRLPHKPTQIYSTSYRYVNGKYVRESEYRGKFHPGLGYTDFLEEDSRAAIYDYRKAFEDKTEDEIKADLEKIENARMSDSGEGADRYCGFCGSFYMDFVLVCPNCKIDTTSFLTV
jgi:hypothetical protein